MTDVTCNGITAQGQRCRSRPLVGTNYCVNHSPDISDEQRSAWRVKGGANSATKVRARKQLPGEAMESDELTAWLAVVFRRLVKGDLEPQIATATANLARTMIAVRESVEIETRLDALEKAVEGQRMSNGRFRGSRHEHRATASRAAGGVGPPLARGRRP